MITIGNLELGKTACVAAVVDTIIPMQDLLDLKRLGVDLLEVRLDLIEKPLDCIEKYLFDLKLAVGLPMIGTVRENKLTSGKRAEYFRLMVPYVDCVDIELGAPEALALHKIAKGARIIVSEHDFEKTPDIPTLHSMAKAAIVQGADIVKIVTMARNIDDAWRLVTFAGTFEDAPMVAFAMGECGTFSRMRACEFGSLFTYGYITKPVAPGQLSAVELVKKLKG